MTKRETKKPERLDPSPADAKHSADDASGGSSPPASPKKAKATKAKGGKAASKGKGGVKKAKAKKDKNAPKRPLSGFMIFSNEHRGRVKVDHPGAGIGEIATVLGKEWNELSDAKKKHYQVEHEKLKVEYEKKKAEYEKKKEAEGGNDDEEEKDE